MARTYAEWTAPVPPMTHELGTYWEQPDPNAWEFSDTSVLMPREDFDKLLEYSSSYPTGAYEGKMWRRHVHSTDTWYLCWYEDDRTIRDRGWVKAREIVIA